jgi:hypothetical protein
MASTYTVNTGIELIANGEQSGTWGDTTNLNLEIIDRLTNGVGEITITGTTHTLTTADGALSPGQFKVLVFVGTPSGTNTVTISPNDQAKQYFVVNNSGESIVLTQGSGTTVTVADGASDIVFADGGGTGANVASLTADLSGVLTTGDIGTTVLAFDTNLQAFVTAFTLPTTDGTSGQTLTTNGSGTLTFSSPATPTIDLTSDVTGILPAANGGTANEFFSVSGPATSTKTYTFPNENMEVGFRNIPQNSQSAAYTLVLADSGKHILHPSADTTARTFTIPANGSVAFPVGTAITFVNQNGAGVVTIAITTDTMRLAGNGTTGSRTLAANGVATAIKITSTEWIISGVGLT